MKKFNLTFAVLLLSVIIGMAQESTRGFNFQAVARKDDGSPKAHASIEIVFGIYSDNESFDPLYKEVQTVTTDQFGVFSATIGAGTQESINAFTEIPYEGNNCELAVWQKDGNDEVLITRTTLLSVPYAKYASQAYFPAGMVIPFAGPAANIPSGWMLCDGSPLDIDLYPKLFDAIGFAWGNPGSNGFSLPDLQGLFLRGAAGDSGRDPDLSDRTGGDPTDRVGSSQDDSFESHLHDYTDIHEPNHINRGTGFNAVTDDYTKTDTKETGLTGGKETRPKNVYVHYIIKL